MNLTTRAEAARALCAHYMPELLKMEDFEAFESLVASDGKSLIAGMMAACLAEFDDSLRMAVENTEEIWQNATNN